MKIAVALALFGSITSAFGGGERSVGAAMDRSEKNIREREERDVVAAMDRSERNIREREGRNVVAAMDRSERNIRYRGGMIDDSIRERERASVKVAVGSAEKAYRNAGSSAEKAARAADNNILKAWEGLRDPKRDRDPKSPLREEELLMYSVNLGRVTIRSDPPGAVLTINAAPEGTTDTSKWIRAGTHKITVTLDGYESQEKTITTNAGTSAVVEFTLVKSN